MSETSFAESRRGLWTSLGLVEDWLAGGLRTEREEPDFDALGDLCVSPPSDADIDRDVRSNEGLAEIAAEIAGCAACRLSAGRSRTVPGQGVASPAAMVVGEGPGAEEDAQGLPFVGPAGRLLDKMLASIGLSRGTNCFIANIVKCRPPGNRDPSPDEQEACIGYLRRQIAVLRPRAVLCVGRVAAQALLGTKDGIGKLRGRWFSFEGLPLLATYHPSAILRDEALKRPAWEDLKLLRDMVARDEAAHDAPARDPPTR
jgi:uracil-DNA glycosylase family 4